MKIVILYSGGLDSKILYEYALKNYPNDEIIKLYYDYDSPVCKVEKTFLDDDVIIRNIDWFGGTFDKLKSKEKEKHKGNVYIPGRNLIFSVLAACQELPDEIWLGATYRDVNDGATDKNLTFIEKTMDVLNYVLSPFKDKIKLRFPFYEDKMEKEEILKWALDNNKESLIHNSISCWNPINVKSCGICHQCLKKQLAGWEYNINFDNYFTTNWIDEEQWFLTYINSNISLIKNTNYKDKTLIMDINYNSLYEVLQKINKKSFNVYINEIKKIKDLYNENRI